MSIKYFSDIQLADNNEAIFGTGSDLKIKHDGSDSLIRNFTGDLYLRNLADDKDIIFQGDDGGNNTITALTLDISDAGKAIFNAGANFSNTVTIITGGPKLNLQDNTDDDDQQINFVNNSGVTDYMIRTSDPTSGGGGDGFYIGSVQSDGEVALFTHNTTALTLDTSQNATFAADITCGDDLFMPSGGVINFNSGDMTITHASNQLTISGGKTIINSLELGAADHVIEDGSNILDENDNTMITLASGVANITGNAATATVLATARNIGGVSFNGSANINLPGVNTSGNQDTSGNAATATALTSGNKTIAGVLDITDTTDSSDATGDTGALRCEGGASIAKKLFTGSAITSSNDVIAFSDRKLKDNIETLDGKKVLDMRGVSFTRKDTGLPGSGVIAQEIQKVAPELIHDTNGTLGVAYGNLVGYLIEAIKDQQKQIDELKEMCSGCSK